jgi:RNA polymerase sigma-70 factor (ECF subfamily)
LLTIILSSVDLDEKNQNKFENIYYKYRNVLFGYAVKILSNQADAEDVLQETFIKVAKNIKTIKDINSKETNAYLAVILKNTAYDFLRKKSKYNEVDIDGIKEIPEDDFIESLAGNIQYDRIVDIIKNIPSPYSEVLYLHFVRDFSVKQTAHLLDRKPETVKMQLVRGKRTLIEMLSEDIND